MPQATQQQTVTSPAFAELTSLAQTLLATGQTNQLLTTLQTFCQTHAHTPYALLAQAAHHYLNHNHLPAVQFAQQARDQLDPADYPDPASLFSIAFIGSQLALPRRQQPAPAQAYTFYRRNIAALRSVDPLLADRVQASPFPAQFTLVDAWTGLHLFAPARNTLLTLDADLPQKLASHLQGRAPITFAAVATGQEIRFCLQHQVNILHGMARAHYLFESDPALVKALLHLDDFADALQTAQLTIFSGPNAAQRVDDVFGTLRYAPPNLILGDASTCQDHLAQVANILSTADRSGAVKAYYASEAFAERLEQIAQGLVAPRILFFTCRWTTFLKYCAADFQRAFDQIGCPTRYLIEENDVQHLSAQLHWRVLHEFKPDAVFMVSHSRPSNAHFPRQLPFIAYIQDKCGPTLTLTDFRGHITGHDLFLCVVEELQQYLCGKHLPAEQTLVLPMPGDDTLFFPLPADHERGAEFACAISYVKHGNADTDAIFADWLATAGLAQPDNPLGRTVAGFFRELYAILRKEPTRRWYEPDLLELAQKHLWPIVGQENQPAVTQLVSTFFINVYAACRRRFYLHALADAALPLRLYGNHWDKDPRLNGYAAGPATRDKDLNLVYNFSTINLHLHPNSTMHPRLAECGLARAFIMVADHAQEHDALPARHYFEPDSELVLFDSPADLIDRCRYFLAHDEHRLQIAQAMHQRARREQTCTAAARIVLDTWRQLLNKPLPPQDAPS